MPHITFIHGIANKPPEDRLLASWERALAAQDGINLGAEGVTTSMVYWADVMYGAPKDEAGFESLEAAGHEFERSEDIDLGFIAETEGDEAEFLDKFKARLNFDIDVDEDEAPPESEAGVEYERIPLPGWLKKRLMKALLRDVHHYLYNSPNTPREGETYLVQDEIRRRITEKLTAGAEAAGNEPHVIVAHSMGTVMAYDCLKRHAEVPHVDGLLTLGSPLGLDEIQDAFAPEWSRNDGFPSEKLTGAWCNVFDRLDPVAGLDPVLANDYKQHSQEVVNDLSETNGGAWRHSVSKYLGRPRLRAALADMLDL
jgi:hypothetical protein